MTNLDSILKSRDITLATNVRIVKAMVFPVVMYGYENWTKKKDEHQRIDDFELWYLRRLLRVLWAARRSNQSILQEINCEHSFEGLMLKQKLQYFGPLIRRTDSLEKTLILRRIEGGRWTGSEDGWMASLTRWTWVWGSSGDGEGQGGLACCSPWGHKESDTTEQQHLFHVMQAFDRSFFMESWDLCPDAEKNPMGLGTEAFWSPIPCRQYFRLHDPLWVPKGRRLLIKREATMEPPEARLKDQKDFSRLGEDCLGDCYCSIAQLDRRKSKRIPEKYLLLHWLR